MQAGKSVQFNNSENIVAAYQLRAVPAFSIYQGKQLMIKYEGSSLDEGSDLLAQFIDMLQNSAAIYTLCVYEEYQGKINDKTPYHGSWNFRFNDQTNFQQVSGISGLQQQLSQMNNKIEQLSRDRIEDELDQESEEDQVTSTMDKIAGFLSHPVVEKFFPVILAALQPGSQKEMTMQPAALAGIAESSQQEIADQGEAVNHDEKLSEAVLNMIQAAPESYQALIQLGDLAKNNPKKFKGILGYLKFL